MEIYLASALIHTAKILQSLQDHNSMTGRENNYKHSLKTISKVSIASLMSSLCPGAALINHSKYIPQNVASEAM
jgi:hypothetical protein